MKLLLALTVLSAGIMLAACSAKPSADTTPGTVIEFKNGQYSPNKITIKQNQKVTFMNQSDHDIWPASNIHPTHGIYPEFDPKKPVKPEGSWSFTFNKVGVWKYHDHLQPQITGEIKVSN